MNPMPAVIDLTPVEQAFNITPGQMGDDKAAMVLFTQPLASFVVILDRNAGLALADQLREFFGQLQIVRDVPPTNGQHP